MSLITFQRLASTATLVAGALIGSLASSAAMAVAPPATSFSQLVFFGDSLSDSGNLHIATGGFPAPYSTGFVNVAPFGPIPVGRASNGPVWTEQFAALMGRPNDALPSLAGFNNYSFAGARTGTTGSAPGVLVQLGSWSTAVGGVADPNALYVMVAGGNDMRVARSEVGGTTVTRQAAAVAAIANLQTGLSMLQAAGASNVLLSNLPNLGNTPEAVFGGTSAISTDATNRFNSLLPGLMSFGSGLGLNMFMLDMAGIPTSGFTNTTMPCGAFPGSLGASCATSLFSDALHPTSAAHGLIAAAAVTAVPEPQTVALMLAGLLLVGGVARRRAAAATAA